MSIFQKYAFFVLLKTKLGFLRRPYSRFVNSEFTQEGDGKMLVRDKRDRVTTCLLCCGLLF